MPDIDFAEVVRYLFVAGAIYGGIRADLRAIHARVAAAQASADKAHDRLDNLILKGH